MSAALRGAGMLGGSQVWLGCCKGGKSSFTMLSLLLSPKTCQLGAASLRIPLPSSRSRVWGYKGAGPPPKHRQPGHAAALSYGHHAVSKANPQLTGMSSALFFSHYWPHFSSVEVTVSNLVSWPTAPGICLIHRKDGNQK